MNDRTRSFDQYENGHGRDFKNVGLVKQSRR